MPTADDVLRFFRDNNGLKESPPGSNCNWLTKWAGLGCVPWCAITVSRAINEAWGDAERWPLDIDPTFSWGFAYVPYVRQAFERAGRYHQDPQRGDLVIFDWDGDGWGDHIGVFDEDLGDGTCLTWEGNTSSNDLSQRRRPFSLIAGFCRLPYDSPTQEDELTQEQSDTLRYIADVVTELKDQLCKAAGTDNWHRVGENLKAKLDRIK